MHTRHSITNCPVAHCARYLIQTTNKKKKIQTESSADRITTSLNLAHQRKNKKTNPITRRQDYCSDVSIRGKANKTNKQKFSTTLNLYEAYTNHWANLRREETKQKKEFNFEAWKKEASNTVS